LWKRIFKSIKAIRRKEIKTNVGKTDGFSIPLRTQTEISDRIDITFNEAVKIAISIELAADKI